MPADRSNTPPSKDAHRIAKLLARAGVASRREIERMIADGRIARDGVLIDTPATILTSLAGVTVDGDPVTAPEPARLFLFHKPRGVLTTEHDPAGRPTIYDRLPKDLPRLVPVGRLDLNTEGLLLMTTDGELKRLLELPATGVERAYRARAYGNITQAQLEDLIEGVEIEGIRYGSIDANLERRTGANVWIEMILTEGKNREVRRVLEYLGLEVSRLIRTRYGPFVLGDLPVNGIGEVRQNDLVAFRKAPTNKTLQPVRAPETLRPTAARPPVSNAGATEPERPSTRPQRPPSPSKPRVPRARPEPVAEPPRAGRGRMVRGAAAPTDANERPTRAPRGAKPAARAKPDRLDRTERSPSRPARGKPGETIAQPARAARARAHRDATGMTTATERPASAPRGGRPAPAPAANQRGRRAPAGNMRIIAGQWRGRPIVAPKGDATRPTADRTREALFSMLASRLGSFEDLSVADLFAGSGALGLEALSRGAASCLFVEQDHDALDALKANVAKLGAKADVRAGSVLALGPAPAPRDVILMDPPYGTGAGIVALDKLNRLGWIGAATWITLETAKQEEVELPGFAIDASRVHGKARITLLRLA